MSAWILALLLPSAAPDLPAGLALCSTADEVRAALPQFKELSDDMWETALKHAGLDGFATAILDGGRLVELRLRFYETPGTWDALLGDLRAGWGEPSALRPHTAADPRGKGQWSVSGVQVELKASQEQFFVRYSVPYTQCQSPAPAATATPTAAPPTGIQAWDPYAADDDPAAPVVQEDPKKAEAEARKQEEEARKKKEAEAALDDKDIDW